MKYKLHLLFIFSFFILNENKAITLFARANANWNVGTTWSTVSRTGASCACTPTAVDDVIIDGRNVTVTGAPAVANSVTLTNASVAGNVTFRVTNGRTLTIGTDFTIIANNDGDDMNITIDTDASSIIVGGDMIVDIDAGEITTFTMTNNTQINITDDLLVDIDLTTSNNLIFNLSNDAGTDHILVGDDFLIDKDGGREVLFNLSNAAEIQVNDDFSLDWDASSANDTDIEFNLTNTSRFDVNGTTVVDMNETVRTGCDIDFDIDNTCVTEFGLNDGLLLESATFSITAGNQLNLELDRDAVMNVYGNLILTQDGDSHMYLTLNLNANGAVADAQLRVDGNLTMTKTDGDEFQFRLREEADADIGGDLTINCTAHDAGGQNDRIEMINNSTIDVDGSLSFILNSTGNTSNNLWLDMENNAAFFVGINDGALTESATITLTEGLHLNFDMDSDTRFEVYGNLNMNHAGDGNLDVHLDVNTNGTTTDAQLRVDGNMTMAKTDGDRFQFQIRQDSDLDIGGDLIMTDDFHQQATDHMLFRLFDNAVVDIDGSLSMILNSLGNTNNDLMLDLDDDVFLFVGINDGARTESATFTVTEGAALELDIDKDGSMTVFGNCIMTASGDGAMDLHFDRNGNGNGTDAQLRIDGDWTMTKDDGDRYFLDLNQDSDILVGGNTTITSTNHDAANDNDEFEISAAGTFTCLGNFTWTLNSTGNASNDMIFDMNTAATFSVGPAAGPYNTNSCTFNFVQGDIGNFDIDGTSVLNIYGDLNIVKTGGGDISLDMNANQGTSAQINVYQDFDLDNTENADRIYMRLQNTSSLLDVDRDIDLIDAASAGRIEIELNSTSKIEIGRNFLRDDGFGMLDCNSNSIVEYNGITNSQLFAQDAGAGGDAFDYQFVIINNTFGTAPQLTMEGLATIQNGITFTDGIISSTATNILVINNNASKTGASDASHVDGFIRKIGNTPAGEFAGNGFEFPVGDSEQFRPAYITAPALTTDAFESQYLLVDPHADGYDSTLIAGTLNHISHCEYWLINRTAGASNVSVRLSWDDNSCGVASLADLRVARWNGALWADHGNGGTTGVPDPGAGTVVTSAVVTAFSPFTLASTTRLNDLPVEFISFNAVRVNNFVDVLWSTASETNSAYFEIERAGNDMVFSSIGIKYAAGNSSSVINYSFTDENPLSGNNYYRLKQVDINGDFVYTEIKVINFNSSVVPMELLVYPNPTEDCSFSLITDFSSSQNWTMNIYSLEGKLVFTQNLNSITGSLLQTQFDTKPKAGIYFVELNNGVEKVTTKLVVR